MENQQELMQKFQMFEQQMQQIQQQLQAIEQGIIDLSNLNLGLDELVGKEGKEPMNLVGKGIFVKTKLLSEELVVDVGGKNFVSKSIPDTKQMIVEQIGKLQEAKEILTENMEKSGADFQQMIMEAQNAEQNQKESSGEHKHECCGKHKEGEEHECCGGKGEDCECSEEGCEKEDKKEEKKE